METKARRYVVIARDRSPELPGAPGGQEVEWRTSAYSAEDAVYQFRIAHENELMQLPRFQVLRVGPEL